MNTEQAFTFLAQGAYGMCLQGTWAFAWVPASFGVTGAELATVPLPRFGEDVDYPIYPYGLGGHLAINAASRNKDLAAAALDILMQPDFLNQISVGWSGAWDVPLPNAGELGPEADDVTRQAHAVAVDTSLALQENRQGYLPWSFWPPRTDDFMKGGIEEVWVGSITAEQFCNEVDRILQEELAEGVVKFPPERKA